MTRRRLVPEVIQTSGMDCGPACLTSLLAGFGVHASYGRIREACQTDVDGTSIDTIEEIARELGLDAAQVVIPVDHVAPPGEAVTPAIAVVTLPGGVPHFVVAWSRALGRFQVMDPARGRRWVAQTVFLDDLYIHEMNVSAADWRESVMGDDFCGPLARRLEALGARDARARIERALADPDWQPIATLDAATRMTAALIAGGGLSSGDDATAMLDTLVGAPTAIPAMYWHARATESAAEVRLRGAVVVQVTGARAAAPKSRELAAALAEAPPRPWRTVAAAMMADGALRPVLLALAAGIAAAGVIVEVMLFRTMFEIGDVLATVPQLLAALAVLVAFLVAMTLIEVPLRTEALRIGRRTEIRLRSALLAKLPRLGLHYLRSRPVSDMSERGHMLHRLRELPPLGVRIVRACGEIVATTGALIWLAPRGATLVIGLAIASLVPPILAQRVLAERELRMRTHGGALARFYLDALVGTMPARATGVEDTLLREHEGLLVDWSQAARAEHSAATAIAVIQSVLGYGMAVAVVLALVDASTPSATMLLLVYWALAVPTTGQLLAAALRDIPGHRNSTLRLLEPLGALDDETTDAPANRVEAGGADLALEGVSVVAGGHTILRRIDLRIAPGEHVAIVGVSGGGKSTLLGLLLGWSRPSEGVIRVDGELLDAQRLVALRQATAWIDPGVTLWNDSIANNLAYGTPAADLSRVAAEAELESMLARFPEGLSTQLGEGGGLVSGGEGQRIRVGRGLARVDVRLAVLDEPFRGLDRETRRRMLATVRERWRDATLLVVTHDLAETAAFARVLVIEDGQLVEDGAPAELAAREGSRYAALLAGEQRAAAVWSAWQHVRLAGGKLEERT